MTGSQPAIRICFRILHRSLPFYLNNNNRGSYSLHPVTILKINEHISSQKDIDAHIDKHSNLQKDRALLQSIPAIGPQVGSNTLSVMHNHDFGSAEQLAAYLGIVPVERQCLPIGAHGIPLAPWCAQRRFRYFISAGTGITSLPSYSATYHWLEPLVVKSADLVPVVSSKLLIGLSGIFMGLP